MQDMASMLMQWYMMKKMFPSTKKTETDVETPTEKTSGQYPLWGQSGQQIQGMAPGQMGQSGGNDHIQQLIQYMKKIGVI